MALPCALSTNPLLDSGLQAGMTATWAPAFKLNASVKYSHCPNQQAVRLLSLFLHDRIGETTPQRGIETEPTQKQYAVNDEDA